MSAGSLLDALVVGGGPAGLAAGVYLARYRRSLLVIDSGDSRLAWIPRSRNVPGYPDGIPGGELLVRLRAHAQRYRVPLLGGRATMLEGADGDFSVRLEDGRPLRARTLLLATGARDVEPDLPGLRESLATGTVRYCPVCDGFETAGQRVAVLGPGAHGAREALFLAGFANQVSWLALGSQSEVAPDLLARLRARGVLLVAQRPRHMRCVPGQGVQVALDDGRMLDFDTLYPALGLRHASQLAAGLGAALCENGQVQVDDHQQTTVPGLFAAGDVSAGLNQIAVAWGQAAIAATAMHNRL